jgi:hypothetical protein
MGEYEVGQVLEGVVRDIEIMVEGEGAADYGGQPWRELYAESAVEIASLVRATTLIGGHMAPIIL